MAGTTKKPRVVIVDDDETQLCIAELFLEEEYDVVCYADARQAICALLQEAPAVIVSDIHMPDMDGISLRNELCRLGVDVPFVFLTGDAVPGALPGNSPDGPVEWLQKPIEKAQLLERVARVLSANLKQPSV